MARYATASDFFGGAMYTEYKRFQFHIDRAVWILQKWPQIVGQKVAIIGCGPGAYLVEELVNRGVDAYGLDGFTKNAGHGFVTISPAPAIASRCLLDVDVTNNSDVSRFRQLTGTTGNRKFYLAVSEDVLSCLTLQEAGFAVAAMQARSDRNLHILTCNRSPDGPDPERDTTMGLNWFTQAAWRTLINQAGGSTHICLDVETWQEF